jgi:MFS family permease
MTQSNEKKPKRKGLRLSLFGLALNLGGIAFAFLPFIVGFALETFTNTNATALGFFGILTIPVGIVGSLIGLGNMMFGVGQILSQKFPSSEHSSELRAKLDAERSIAVALLIVPMFLTQPLAAFVLGRMIIGNGAEYPTITAFSAAIGIAAVLSILFAIKSRKLKIAITMSIINTAAIAVMFVFADSLTTYFRNFS